MTSVGIYSSLRAAAFFLLLISIFVWASVDAVANSEKPVIEITRPAEGQTKQLDVPESATFRLLFDASDAQLFVDEDDLVFWFESDDAQVVLTDLLLRSDLSKIDLVLNGNILTASALIDKLLPPGETGGGERPNIEPAAGEDSNDDDSLPNLSGLRHTGRDLLFPLEIEREGHPLYSYLLFSGASSGKREERARFSSAIEAYVGQVKSADTLEKSGAARASINIFYAPLKEIFEDTSPASMRLHFAQRSPEEQVEILTRLYDHARAEVLMGQMRLRGNGPFIVSVLRPLSDGAITQGEAFLVQDLSSVPPKLAGLWVDEFKRQVVQEATGSPERLRRFALSLRTKISVLAEGFAITKSAVAEMFDSPKSNGGE